MYYPEELVEEIRSKNDIVDDNFQLCETSEKRKHPTLDYVHFIMKNPRHFQSSRQKQ